MAARIKTQNDQTLAELSAPARNAAEECIHDSGVIELAAQLRDLNREAAQLRAEAALILAQAKRVQTNADSLFDPRDLALLYLERIGVDVALIEEAVSMNRPAIREAVKRVRNGVPERKKPGRRPTAPRSA
jgi:hypothetical protein